MSKTLAEIITLHETHRSAQTVTLTPRGTIDRLTRQLVAAWRTLPPQERAEALMDFAPHLRDVIAELATPTSA